MIELKEALKIVYKNKPDCTITSAKEFPDKFLFVCIPKGADPDSWISNPMIIKKKDGKVSYETLDDGVKGTKIDLSELKHQDTSYSYLCHNII